MAPFAKSKKSWLILEVLIALSLLAICLFPFIPKGAGRYISLKNKAAYVLFSHDFEGRVAELHEKAFTEGPRWVQGKKGGDLLFEIHEKVQCKDLSIEAQVDGKVILRKIYDQKQGPGHLYRLTLKLNYSSKQLKKKVPFVFYFTLGV